MAWKLRQVWIACGIGFVLLVVHLSLTPDPPNLGVPEGLKIGHLVAYGWLMIWFGQVYRTKIRRFLLAAALCALGIALEYVQGLTDNRGFENTDMMINAMGVALGLALVYTRLQNIERMFEAMLELP